MSELREHQLRSYTQHQKGTSKLESPLDQFMVQWLLADQPRAEHDERIHQEDCQQIANQQEQILEIIQRSQMTKYPNPPTHKLTLQKFQEGMDDMESFLETFKIISQTAGWLKDLWPAYLSNSLSGASMVAALSLSALDQVDYQVVKDKLYQISNEA